MTKELQGLKEGMLWKAISTGINSVAGFIASVIFARFLGRDRYGELILVYTIVSLFMIASNFGLNAALQRFIPLYITKRDSKGFTKFIITTSILGISLTLFFSLIMFFASHLISVNILHNPSLVIYMKWGTVYLFTISILTNIIFPFYYGLEKWKEECLLNAFYLSVYILGAILVLKTFKDGIISIIEIGAFSSLVGIVTGFLYLKKYLKSINMFLKIEEFASQIKETINFSAPIFMSGVLFYFITQFDKIILGRYRPTAELSQYYVAFALGTGIIMCIKISETVLTTYLAKFADEKEDALKERFQVMFRLFLHLSVIVCIVLYFIADPFINLVYGKNFGIASKALKIYLPTIVLRSSMTPVGLFLTNVYGKTFEVTKISIVNALAHLGLYLLLIPAYGYAGAMATTVLATSLAWFYIILFIKDIRALIPFRSLLCAAAGMALVCGVYLITAHYRLNGKLIFMPISLLTYGVFIMLKEELPFKKMSLWSS